MLVPYVISFPPPRPPSNFVSAVWCNPPLTPLKEKRKHTHSLFLPLTCMHTNVHTCTWTRTHPHTHNRRLFWGLFLITVVALYFLSTSTHLVYIEILIQARLRDAVDRWSVSVHFVPCGLLSSEEGGRTPRGFFSSPVSCSFFSHGRTRVGEVWNCEMLRHVTQTPLGAPSRFSPVLVFRALNADVYPSISPVGHWVSVTVNTNMLRHAFDPLPLANTATCCSLLVQRSTLSVSRSPSTSAFFLSCAAGEEKSSGSHWRFLEKNRKFVFPAKLLIHIRPANVTPSQSQLHPAQKMKMLHVLLGYKVHLRVQIRKK